MNFYQHSPEQINQLADALEDPDLDMKGLGWKAAFHLRELQALILDLEAQLCAIGAGGVGASIQPQAQPPAPQQEPVAWKWRYKDGELSSVAFDTWEQCESNSDGVDGEAVPLYAAPQQPVQQEPVAWIEHEWSGTGLRHLHFEKREPMVRDEVVNPVWTPLYTAPPQRQQLTDEQIWADDGIMSANSRLGLLMKDLALLVRAIEQAHGITREKS